MTIKFVHQNELIFKEKLWGDFQKSFDHIYEEIAQCL